MSRPAEDAPTTPLVLDTNVVLDLLVFRDASVQPLTADLALGKLDWLATSGMRGELESVLGYPQLASRLALLGLRASDVLGQFDDQARIVQRPAKAPVTCSDPDDQKFIDLAASHRCLLLSKDAAVLKLARKLAALGVTVAAPCAEGAGRSRHPGRRAGTTALLLRPTAERNPP